MLAPLSVPLLLDLGGSEVLLFTVFAGCFALAAVATWGLPERRGLTLDERLDDVR